MGDADTIIAQTIQLALAPVFVLVAIGSILNILSTRLGRVVDRWRYLEPLFAETSGNEHDEIVRELRVIDRRIKLIQDAILVLVMSGLVIGLVVVLLFFEEFAGVDLQVVAAAGFSLAIGLLMWALFLFLRETRVASNALAIPRDYLELERKL